MLGFAVKMLLNDRAKFLGILIGLVFASFIATQQAGIFIGLMSRTYGFITDTSQPNIWVMDREVQFVEDLKPLKNNEVFRVRGVEGVEWAVPLFKRQLKARFTNGVFQICNVIGIDSATFIGAPPIMLEGSVLDLRNPDAVIVNQVGAEGKLAHPDGSPLRLGENFEIEDHRAVVVGFCKVERTFQTQPVVYTTFDRALTWSPAERKMLTYILARSVDGMPVKEVCQRIRAATGLAAYTASEFKRMTVEYYVKNTGILLNFGFAVFLGFLVGSAIAGQTFYNFALDNARYFGTYKAMGASKELLSKMVGIQALTVGSLGWAIGVGCTSIFALTTQNTDLSFRMPWQLLLGSFLSILLITCLSALLSLWKILRLEPGIVFRS